MILIEDAEGFSRKYGRCVATIGKFDGIHLGHQRILEQLRAAAGKLELPSLAIVIEPHPEEFFADSDEDCPARLMDLPEKLQWLGKCGIDFSHVLEFDAETSRIPAEDYIRGMLVEDFGIAALIIGDDFRFGHRRGGDFALLQRKGAEYGFRVHRSLVCELEGGRVSSSAVRRALAMGDFVLAERLLGRPYSVRGVVARGKQLGGKLGFPTCNIELRRRRIPLHGIYACHVETGGAIHPAAVSIGYRPTVVEAGKPLLEAHLLDFDGVLYGETIEVVFRGKVRGEEKFDSLEELRRQMIGDVESVRSILTTAAYRP